MELRGNREFSLGIQMRWGHEVNIKSSRMTGLFAVKGDGVLNINETVAVDKFVLTGSSAGKGKTHPGVDDEVVHKRVFVAAADNKSLMGHIVDDVVCPQRTAAVAFKGETFINGKSFAVHHVVDHRGVVLFAAGFDLNDRAPSGVGADVAVNDGAVGFQINGRTGETDSFAVPGLGAFTEDLAVFDQMMTAFGSGNRNAPVEVPDDVPLHGNIVSIDQDTVDIGVFGGGTASAAQNLIVVDDGIGQMGGASLSDLSAFAQHNGAAADVPQNIAADVGSAGNGGVELHTHIAIGETAVDDSDGFYYRTEDVNASFSGNETAIFKINDADFDRLFTAAGSVNTESAFQLHVTHNERGRLQFGISAAAVQVDHSPPLFGREACEFGIA